MPIHARAPICHDACVPAAPRPMHVTVETGHCASGHVNARSVARTSKCEYISRIIQSWIMWISGYIQDYPSGYVWICSVSGVIRIILDYPGLSRFWIILDMFGYIRIIRVYGMEGAAAEEGEAQTRNIESSYRRLPSSINFNILNVKCIRGSTSLIDMDFC